MVPPDLFQSGNVAVGDKINGNIRVFFGKMVIVLDDHQHIARRKGFLAEEDVPPDPFVELIRPFVGPGNDDYVFHSVAVVGLGNLLQEFAAVDLLHIRKIRSEKRDVDDILFDHTTDQGSVE